MPKRRPHALLAALTAAALALAACMPEPPQVILSVTNEDASACATLRAKLTYAGGTIEASGVQPGEQREAGAAAPSVTQGKPATVEAWCDTGTTTGYAKLEGDLAELTSRVTPIHVTGPGSEGVCRDDLAASTDPAPCINTNAIQ